jgi:cyclin-dependent kinase-like
LGPLIPEQMSQFMQNPRYVGFKFPDMTRPETLQSKYQDKMSDAAISLMNVSPLLVRFFIANLLLQALLQMDPDKRPTGEQCLAHP